jgi:hypothetical protein
MAVASGGGHWIQLMRLLPALAGHDLCFVSTSRSAARAVPGARFHTAVDANRTTPVRMGWLLLQMALYVLRFRPEVVVTTGAAPGYWACRFGRWLGARTLWIDSVANAEVLSLSGQKAGRIVDLWLTQWQHLAGGPDAGPDAGPDGGPDRGQDNGGRGSGPEYRGSVL